MRKIVIASALSLGMLAGTATGPEVTVTIDDDVGLLKVERTTLLADPPRRRKSPKIRYTGSLAAGLNRWDGKPHQHKREIERRLKRKSK